MLVGRGRRCPYIYKDCHVYLTMETAKLKAQIECMTRIICECDEIGLTNLANRGKECLKEAEQQLKKQTIRT